ncbi:MAG: YfhO family protein [Bacteroidetes bacterium]|nr:YfhO family protein [Bacteroidota bacterium]
MMEKIKEHLSRQGWHYAAAVLFYVLASLLLSKSFDGYVVRQGDIQNYLGMSKEVTDARVLFDGSTAWTNSMFGGMPTTHISAEKPDFDVVTSIKKGVNSLFHYKGMAIFFLAMLGGYLLAISLGAQPWIAMLCGIGMGLSTFEVLYFSAGHSTKVQAVAFMPFVLAGVIWAYRKNVLIGASLAAFGTALHVSSGHPQMTYYLLFLLVGIGVVETWRIGWVEKKWKRAFRTNALLIVAGFIGLAPRISHLMETNENAQHTIRGNQLLTKTGVATASGDDEGLSREYILEYSMADGEWWSIMCPDIKGGNSPLYWGEQTFSGGAFYFGAILVALFFMFLVAGRDRLRWPLLIVTVLAVMLSRRSGGWLMDFFFEYVPAFTKFRDTKMMLILVLLAVCIGAGLALKEMITEAESGMSQKRRWWWLGSFGGLFLLFLGFFVAPQLFFDFTSEIRQDGAVMQLGAAESLSQRLAIFRADVARTLLLLVLLGSILGVMLWRKLNPKWAVLILLGITTIDLWNVNLRYFNAEKSNGVMRNWVKAVDYSFPYGPSQAMYQVLQSEFPKNPENEKQAKQLYAHYLDRLSDAKLTRNDKQRLEMISQFGAVRFQSPFRVMNWGNPFADASASYFFQSVGGYHGAKLRRYQDFIEVILTPQNEKFAAAMQSGSQSAAFDALVGLQMLNTRYLFLPQVEVPIPLPNTAGFGWVAKTWTIAEDHDDEIGQTAQLMDAKEAVIHSEFSEVLENINPGAKGEVTLVTYRPDFLSYRVNLDEAGLVVFSEIWYPHGWKAEVDGQEVEPLRANYILRALKIPAGDHEVTWTYVNDKSQWLDLGINLLFVGFVLGTGILGFKRKDGEA